MILRETAHMEVKTFHYSESKNSKYFQIKRILKRKIASIKGIWPYMVRDEEVDPEVIEIMKLYDKKTNNKKNH